MDKLTYAGHLESLEPKSTSHERYAFEQGRHRLPRPTVEAHLPRPTGRAPC